MAKVENLKAVIDAYGVGVRAGLITPTIEDEAAFRVQLGLPEMSAAAKADWAKTDNVRKPITLAGAAGAAAESINDDGGDNA